MHRRKYKNLYKMLNGKEICFLIEPITHNNILFNGSFFKKLHLDSRYLMINHWNESTLFLSEFKDNRNMWWLKVCLWIILLNHLLNKNIYRVKYSYYKLHKTRSFLLSYKWLLVIKFFAAIIFSLLFVFLHLLFFYFFFTLTGLVLIKK